MNDILPRLLSTLWDQYKDRVAYAARYQRMVEERGGRLLNDHIALRTFNLNGGKQPGGVESVARLFTALGYQRKEQYIFADKHLTAWHYEHETNPDNPKIFISQLEVDHLSKTAAAAIAMAVADASDPVTVPDFDILSGKDVNAAESDAVARRLVSFFTRLWQPPKRTIVEMVNEQSQYAAWTLLHGNSVNHFTAYVNEQNVKEWPDIETTVSALRSAGIPMKAEFEGEPGSRLRQSSTQAAMEDCAVVEDDGRPGQLHWSYAYYELAERGNVPGPDGAPMRFQGFLGAQATNLFEMTKRQ